MASSYHYRKNSSSRTIDVMLGTFILDFQTVEFESDSKLARDLLTDLQSKCQLENEFALDEPVLSVGWSFAKLFLSGQFAEKIYALHSQEIENTKGKKIEDKLVSWFGAQLRNKGCLAQVKLAREMKI
ncbi:MAG: hypothetical protein ACRD99_04020 [Nitrososphaera sp.]